MRWFGNAVECPVLPRGIRLSSKQGGLPKNRENGTDLIITSLSVSNESISSRGLALNESDDVVVAKFLATRQRKTFNRKSWCARAKINGLGSGRFPQHFSIFGNEVKSAVFGSWNNLSNFYYHFQISCVVCDSPNSARNSQQRLFNIFSNVLPLKA